MLFSSSPPWKPAIPPRTPARRRNPQSFLCCNLDSRVNAPVLAWERSDHSGLLSHSSASPLVRDSKLLRGPELGLLSVLFVLSAIVASYFALAIVSFPASNAFRRLKVSSDKLTKVVSEEVPGTLTSLKLSGMEINDLTSELNNLRFWLCFEGKDYLESSMERKKERTNKHSSYGGRSNPIIN